MIKNLTKSVVSGFCLFVMLIYTAESQTCQWASRIAGTGDEVIVSSAVDANGNVLVGGYFNSSTIYFNNGISLTNSGSNDGFIAKYNANGTCQWATKIAGTSDDRVQVIAVDASGNVYVTGYFSTSILNFNNGIYISNSDMFSDGFIAKFNTNGICQWATKISAKYNMDFFGDFANGIAVDINDYVYVCGHYESKYLVFNNGISLTNTFWDRDDAYIAKYNSSGICQWATDIGGINDEYSNSIAVDANGNSYIAGNFYTDTVHLNNGIYLTCSSNKGGYIAKYNSNGTCQWASLIAGMNFASANSIKIDANNNIYVAGQFITDTLNFNNGLSLIKTDSGYSSGFISKFNNNGNCQWASLINGNDNDFANILAVDTNSNIYVAGYFSSSLLNFNNGISLTNNGGFDGFFAKYNPGGKCLYAEKISGNYDEYVNSITLGLNNNIYAAGLFGSSIINFNNGKFLADTGGEDGFIAKYNGNLLIHPNPISPQYNTVFTPQNILLIWNRLVDTVTAYIIQISTSSSFDSLLQNQLLTDTSLNLTGLSCNAQYFWRVQAINYENTSEWSDYRSFRIICTPVIDSTVEPILVSPVNSSTNNQINTSMRWNQITNASHYNLQLSFSISFDTLLQNQVITDTNINLSGTNYNTQYYWRVRAIDSTYTSAWSETWNFTTIAFDSIQPELILPLNASNYIGINPKLTWNKLYDVTSYLVQLSTSSNFNNLILNQEIIDTNINLSLLNYNIQYFWRIKAINESDTSLWSEVWSFTTIVFDSAQPDLISPINNSINKPVNQLFKWNQFFSASSYKIQLSTSSEFITLLQNQEISDTSINFSRLAYNTQFFWRVKAMNESNSSSWSEIWNFTTFPSIDSVQPVLISPVNQSTIVQANVILIWQPVNYALSYRFQLSTTSSFDSLLQEQVISDTCIDLSQLGLSGQYFWRVKSMNQSDTSFWSFVWSFFVIQQPHSGCFIYDTYGIWAFNSITINGNQIVTAPNFMYSYYDTGNIINMSCYDQLSYSVTGFQDITGSTANCYFSVFLDKNRNGSFSDANEILLLRAYGDSLNGSLQLPFLTTQNSYRLRFICDQSSTYTLVSNGCGYGYKFQVYDFILNVIGTPEETLSSPINNSTNIPLNTTLTWNQLTGATSYRVQVSTSSNFTSFVQNQVRTNNRLILLGLNYYTKYFWRVRAMNSNDTSTWSSIWSFNTQCDSIKNINLTQYLQGLWNGSTHQPYPITVELRQGNNLMTSNIISRKAAIIDTNGNVSISFSDVSSGNYWLIVRSAGYMPLAIPQQITLPDCDNNINWNFTASDSNAVGGSRSVIQVGNSWLMRAGDFNSSRNVNSQDLNILLQNNGKSVSGQVPPP